MVGARRTWAVSVLHMVWKKQLQNNFYQKIEPDEKQSRNINFSSNGALAGEAGIEVNRFCSRRPRSYGGRWAPNRPQSRGGGVQGRPESPLPLGGGSALRKKPHAPRNPSLSKG